MEAGVWVARRASSDIFRNVGSLLVARRWTRRSSMWIQPTNLAGTSCVVFYNSAPSYISEAPECTDESKADAADGSASLDTNICCSPVSCFLLLCACARACFCRPVDGLDCPGEGEWTESLLHYDWDDELRLSKVPGFACMSLYRARRKIMNGERTMQRLWRHRH